VGSAGLWTRVFIGILGAVLLPTVVTVAATDLGEILVDQEGMTLYLFEPDEASESTCYDECAANWPPLEGPATAEGIDAELLGTTERTDGMVQVTYNGWPLYHFAGDQSPGDANGQGLQDVWWVMDVRGQAVTTAASADDRPSGRMGY
jgi:predicted lipoprotein with Yx(FWY)xxD motif